MRSAEARDLCLLTLAVPTPAVDNSLDRNGSTRVVQTPSSSTSNISVALGGMAPPAPRAP